MKMLIVESLSLNVDYDRPLAEAIKAGEYGYVNDDINAKNFPPTQKGKAQVEALVVGFDERVESEQVLEQLEKAGMRAATLPELIAIKKQLNYDLVALGSVWRDLLGNRRVPVLWCDGSNRDLSLFWFGRGWGDNYRFLAVRK